MKKADFRFTVWNLVIILVSVMTTACQLIPIKSSEPSVATSQVEDSTYEGIHQPPLVNKTEDITETIDFQARDDELVACSSLGKAENRQISAGVFLVGDIEIDEVSYDIPQGDETLVVFLERDAVIIAKEEVACYEGSIYFLNALVQDQFTTGCRTGCNRVRIIVVPIDGPHQVQCRYVDGATKTMLQNANELSCP